MIVELAFRGVRLLSRAEPCHLIMRTVFTRSLTSSSVNFTPNYTSSQRQSKILEKLMKVKGSRKKTVSSKPRKDLTSNIVPEFLSILGTVRSESQAHSRRRDSLNSLFMGHITDIMAMDSLSQPLVGYGIQVTKVQISRDYSHLNVYWFVPNKAEVKMLKERITSVAKEIRGILVSLNVMGKVPHLVFVHDKANSHLAELEEVLSNADFGPEYEDTHVPISAPEYQDSAHIEIDKNEPKGIGVNKGRGLKSLLEDGVGAMRQNVLGLNHFVLWEKLMLKKKKRLDRKSREGITFEEPEGPDRHGLESTMPQVAWYQGQKDRKAAMDAFINSRKYRKEPTLTKIKAQALVELGRQEMLQRTEAGLDLLDEAIEEEEDFYDEEDDKSSTGK